MNTEPGNKTDRDVFASLFRHAEARPAPPTEVEQTVRAALHEEWLQLTRQRRRRKITWTITMAASLLIASFLTLQLFDRGGTPVYTPVASIERVVGEYSIESPSGFTATSDTLYSSQVIATGPRARLAIQWQDGESIRLDKQTRLQLTASDELRLLAGRIYIDSGNPAAGNSAGFRVSSPAGVVQHLGTRYMVDYLDEQLAVSVRQGKVQVSTGHTEAIAEVGERITVGQGGALQASVIPTWGDDWQWTETITPVFALDGRSMAEFLQWVSRESGRPLQFTNQAAEQLAAETTLRGSVELEPMRALRLMLQTSDLVLRSSDSSIVIDLP